MKKTNDDVIYLTRAEWEAFKKQEAEERMELVRRVERGEITAKQANEEASIFKGDFDPARARTINFAEVVENLLDLKAPRKIHGRRKQKAIHA